MKTAACGKAPFVVLIGATCVDPDEIRSE